MCLCCNVLAKHRITGPCRELVESCLDLIAPIIEKIAEEESANEEKSNNNKGSSSSNYVKT